jgi:uncharacterized protein YxeA
MQTALIALITILIDLTIGAFFFRKKKEHKNNNLVSFSKKNKFYEISLVSLDYKAS